MEIALYHENPEELSGLLVRCARESLRFAKIVPYVRQEEFCTMVRDGPEEFDLYVVARDGFWEREIRNDPCIS